MESLKESGSVGEISRGRRYAGPGLIAVVFVLLAGWTWGFWPDVLIDFGRELYLPWRITQGEVLYRDLASFNGPLSPYLNALWFTLGGASVRTLFVANLALLALFTALSYRVLLAIGDRLSATLAILVFLCVFAFGQQDLVGNYNFMAPYSHELTHGVMLAVAAVAAMVRWRTTGRLGWLAVGGLCVGLTLLTKAEAGVASLAGAGIVFAWPGGSARVRAAGVFAGTILLPPIVAMLLLAMAMPVAQALKAVLTPWSSLLAGQALALPFYREIMGLDRPLVNAVWMLVWAAVWWLVLAPALLLAENWRLGERGARAASLVLFGIYAVVLLLLRHRIAWPETAMALLPVTAGTFAVAMRRGLRSGPDSRATLASAMALLSLALLSKMALHPRVYHYGFALAAPAMMTVIAVLAAWLPEALAAKGARSGLVRAAMAGIALVFSLAHLEKTAEFHGNKPVRVASGADAFQADSRGRFVNRAIEALARLPEDATVAVLPEGATLNFLACRRNPTPYVNFMPLELVLFGEVAMLEAFTRSPPDYIVLVHKDTTEFGFPLFGRDYGARLMNWVREHYAPGPPMGDAPLVEGARFGIQVWSRRPDREPLRESAISAAGA